jgi:hypothetical protein
MEVVTKIFKVHLKTHKIPPQGARELNIVKVTPRIFVKKFLVCRRCEAKYDYDHNLVPHLQEALINIPSSAILYNDLIYKELLKYPPNTTCELIWRKSYHKKPFKNESYYGGLTYFALSGPDAQFFP